ncbi:MAG: PfkB family carbohydrate kinase [Bacteroidota bacterium]
MSAYNIAVLGPVPRDHITTHHGEVIEKYGAALHTAIGMARLLGDEGRVHLVSHIRKRDEEAVRALLIPYPNIDLAHLSSAADQGDVIRLLFTDQNNRIERQTGFMNPIVPEDVRDLMHCDAFVCVPITDYEVPLHTLQYIRSHSNATIIFDAHGPTNTVTIQGERHLRYWIDRDSWLSSIDVLKMNLEESRCCWFEKEWETGSRAPHDEKDTAHLPELAEYVLTRGVSSLIVTLDSDGSATFYLKDGKVHQEIVPAIWVDHVIDTTGCGDSFAGGLGFGLVQSPHDFRSAVRYANALGAQRTQGRTFEVFKSREETDAMIRHHYGTATSSSAK